MLLFLYICINFKKYVIDEIRESWWYNSTINRTINREGNISKNKLKVIQFKDEDFVLDVNVALNNETIYLN